MKKKVAVLYLCSGTYIAFWKSFYHNFNKYFLNSSEVHFYLFTDAKDVMYSDKDNVHIHYTEAKGWPDASLLRYHYFCEIENEIREYDYCFFMNACMLCVNEISENELFVNKGYVLAVEHPLHMRDRLTLGIAEANRRAGFERNEKSCAYVPYGHEKSYVMGAINGGDANAFMDMSLEICSAIDKDKKNGTVGRVFDESYLNKYITIHDNIVILDSRYCYPQVFRLPCEQRIMIMEKINLIDVYSVKFGDNNELNRTKKGLIGEQEKTSTLQKITIGLKYGVSIDHVLKNRGIQHIAIFGYKDMGVLLYELLENSDIEVRLFVDNHIEKICYDIPVIKEQDIKAYNDIDCVVVAHPSLYYSILDRYSGDTSIQFISIDELANECYMEALARK